MAEHIADEFISEDEIVKQRKDKLARLRNEEKYDPYVLEKWNREQTLSYVKEKFSYLESEQFAENVKIVTAGRVMTLRKHGKAMFANIADETETMQLYLQLNEMGEEAYNFAKKWVDSGDWVGIIGKPCRTRSGELTIFVSECCLLSKALRPLPEKWHGLTDTEIRYRQRYTDMIANPEVRDVFRKRAKIIASIRKTLDDHGTLEVETPTLSMIAGGANAKPFETFHNALDISMYLRIATELYLKRLVVGMMGRVYEIGKNFRNEGIDTMHNPEFTLMEVYWSFSDYEDMMDLTEELIRNAASSIGSRQVEWNGISLDFDKPFNRVTMLEAVKNETGIDFSTITDDAEARKIGKEKHLEIKGHESRFAVLNLMFEEFCEAKLIEPTFVMGHPVEISPLAKRDPLNPDYTHRFELFICGKEVANAFSELNDPLDQRARFEDQFKKKEAGDEEAHDFDEDFINAIETGLPPTGGLGVGIDRLVMFLTNSRSIRDVIAFPAMKPKS